MSRNSGKPGKSETPADKDETKNKSKKKDNTGSNSRTSTSKRPRRNKKKNGNQPHIETQSVRSVKSVDSGDEQDPPAPSQALSLAINILPPTPAHQKNGQGQRPRLESPKVSFFEKSQNKSKKNLGTPKRSIDNSHAWLPAVDENRQLDLENGQGNIRQPLLSQDSSKSKSRSSRASARGNSLHVANHLRVKISSTGQVSTAAEPNSDDAKVIKLIPNDRLLTFGDLDKITEEMIFAALDVTSQTMSRMTRGQKATVILSLVLGGIGFAPGWNYANNMGNKFYDLFKDNNVVDGLGVTFWEYYASITYILVNLAIQYNTGNKLYSEGMDLKATITNILKQWRNMTKWAVGIETAKLLNAVVLAVLGDLAIDEQNKASNSNLPADFAPTAEYVGDIARWAQLVRSFSALTKEFPDVTTHPTTRRQQLSLLKFLLEKIQNAGPETLRYDSGNNCYIADGKGNKITGSPVTWWLFAVGSGLMVNEYVQKAYFNAAAAQLDGSSKTLQNFAYISSIGFMGLVGNGVRSAVTNNVDSFLAKFIIKKEPMFCAPWSLKRLGINILALIFTVPSLSNIARIIAKFSDNPLQTQDDWKNAYSIAMQGGFIFNHTDFITAILKFYNDLKSDNQHIYGGTLAGHLKKLIVPLILTPTRLLDYFEFVPDTEPGIKIDGCAPTGVLGLFFECFMSSTTTAGFTIKCKLTGFELLNALTILQLAQNCEAQSKNDPSNSNLTIESYYQRWLAQKGNAKIAGTNQNGDSKNDQENDQEINDALFSNVFDIAKSAVFAGSAPDADGYTSIKGVADQNAVLPSARLSMQNP